MARFDVKDSAPKYVASLTADQMHTQRVLAESRRIAAVCSNEPEKLTVGDLSIVSTEKKRLKNKRGLQLLERFASSTSGDSTEAASNEKLSNLYVGGVLAQGAHACESRKILMKMQQSYLNRVRDNFRVRQQIFKNSFEQQEIRKAARIAIKERAELQK